MRSFPLPLYFAAYGTVLSTILALGWTVQLDPATTGPWNQPGDAWILLATVALPAAALLTFVQAKRRGAPDAEQDRYRLAVRIGQPVGDVTGWSARISHDLREVGVLGIVTALGTLWWSVQAFRYGPWWAGSAMALLSAYGGWLAWRTWRNLRSLNRYVATPGE